MVDSEGFWHHIGKGREVPLDNVVIPLMGRFKGDNGSRHQLQAFSQIDSFKVKG